MFFFLGKADLEIGVAVKRMRGNFLLAPESNKGPVFQWVVDVVGIDGAVRVERRGTVSRKIIFRR